MTSEKILVEAYPLRSELVKKLPYERYMGIESTLRRAGFKEAGHSPGPRKVMRYDI